MSDVDWINYAKDLQKPIKDNQNLCETLRRSGTLTKNEQAIIDLIDITNDCFKVIFEYSKNMGLVLARVDDNQIDSKTQIRVINESIGTICKRLQKLEDK